jgi:hypothetical protein
MGKLLVLTGLVLVAVGAAVHFGLPLGRLPGDIVVKRGTFTFYLPLASGVLVSVVLTLLLALLRR